MRDSLEHLPKLKQDELKLIVERILAFIDPAMIILFGSYARGDYKEESDLDPDRKSGHASDYDVLIITEHKSIATNTNLGTNINNSCQKLDLSAHPKIISHYLKYVNDRLAKGQYFFTDIVKDGIALYDSGKHKLAEAKELTPAEQKQIAQEHYDQCFEQTKGFYDHYEYALAKQDNKLAAFMLNQSAENCFKATVLVCTSYVPKEHHLNVLGLYCAKYDIDLLGVFPMETQEQKDLFELLDYAYIGARYDKDYKITKEQLEQLAKYVKKLQRLTKKICKEKIESFV